MLLRACVATYETRLDREALRRPVCGAIHRDALSPTQLSSAGWGQEGACVARLFARRALNIVAIQVKFNKGDDLNLVVFRFYEEKVPNTYPGQNYVSADGLIRRRYVPDMCTY